VAAEETVVEEKIWNWVVANISLMAFGTSAPEILLS
jgi:solute carrier family 8 (sodium/calcium exchanger)